ncbi:ImmA/IrrE family metallo-endopeptidase [Cytobacillus firmus]|uniref:ImmA/IrrE family metallo-endopeptidase n=1 Tax=Cytobacillus firmus TaxID=1399 RepID=UPI00237B9874|nr:ImmA/IrrE family metallo-endopeptidase [Cytobacillus firmus]MDD9312657.1 ImmA/IrrE family metallo-endopeptidase [Cytobacillus firmus]
MIPSKVKVAGIDYVVNQVGEISNNPFQMGEIIYQKSLIQIKHGMSEDKKEQTLVHELLHACFNEAGFEDQDEDMINRVGIVLYQVLKDNNLYFGKPVVETDSGMKMTMNY